MTERITIAIDAMGGENSPSKIIEGISQHSINSNDAFYNIFGNEKLINPLITKYKIKLDKFKIINTEKIIKDTDTALGAAKKGKDTSIWLAMESLKKGESDCVVSAGNTAALFVIAKLNLDMITNIDKPALSALWPNRSGMNVVLDLGANIECNEKNLIDFSEMGAALYQSLYPNDKAKVALLNIGSEEIKGTELLKSTYSKLKILDEMGDFKFNGYIEGNHITKGDCNVIVTDGFTGNIALKTAEGTANFITCLLYTSDAADE